MKIRNSLLILSILLALVCSISAKSQTLSPEAQISLLTCSPGEDLYALFGHTALRVKDKKSGIDYVFNYGTFDFSTPNFYMKFARGKLNYMLSATNFLNFKQNYIEENRSIIEQKLRLAPQQKQQIFRALLTNYKPQNRYYHYDFLFDNCSTRVRDVVEDNARGITFIPPPESTSNTFWNLLDPFITQSRWIFLGIHLALGLPCDETASPYQNMFLPDHLMTGFAHAQNSINNNTMPLVESTHIIYKANSIISPTPYLLRPITLFSIIALIFLASTLWMIREKRYIFWPDTILFSMVGIVGWVVFFLWFLTDHLATGPNLNILWAFPLHLPLALWLQYKKRPLWVRRYFRIHAWLLISVIALWPLIPQSLPLAVLPLVATLALRSLFISKYFHLLRN